MASRGPDLFTEVHNVVAGYTALVSREALTDRAVFYARCKVFEDLAYGIDTAQDKYVDNSLAAMEWLFPV
jgi:hypothetical protein